MKILVHIFILLSICAMFEPAFSFCVHNEDCFTGQCCVNHHCVDCNILRRHGRDTSSTQNLPPANDQNQPLITRSKRSNCGGCLGICMCIETACICIPIK